MNVVACITVRMTSERLPGKVLADIAGKPALARVVERYRAVRGVDHIVVATSTEPSDVPIAKWCHQNGVSFHCGPLDDVCQRIVDACEYFSPDYVLRGLGDCTFIEPKLQEMLLDVASLHDADAVRMVTSAHVWPVYGAAESPYSWRAVQQMNDCSSGSQREHFGTHLDANRTAYNVVYPLPSRGYNETYYRPYRLELDTEADLFLMNTIYEMLGPDREPPLHEVIDLLDSCPDLALINATVAEKTGPLTSFTPEQRRQWVENMRGGCVVDWSGDGGWEWIQGYDAGAKPIWCASGRCYLGYVNHIGGGRNELIRPGGDRIQGNANLSCSCGADRRWIGRSK
jgi:spore coat polysaccharide biosynthesis protein SpsF (cytidylyltransferase family)